MPNKKVERRRSKQMRRTQMYQWKSNRDFQESLRCVDDDTLMGKKIVNLRMASSGRESPALKELKPPIPVVRKERRKKAERHKK